MNLEGHILKFESTSEDSFLSDIYFSMVELINETARGPLLEMGLYHYSQPGKMIRSRIIYNLGVIYDVNPHQLLNWAMACELLHEASLIHDDLQDGDQTRRGQKTIWAQFGNSQAINLGDFLLMLSYRPLETLPYGLTKLHSKTAISLVQGQASEFELNLIKKIETPLFSQYLKCVEGKTGALFSSLAQGVSILANCNSSESKFLETLFLKLGVVFQIQDDLLDLFGDKKRGFQGSDIQEGKCSVLVALHYDHFPEDRSILKSILHKSRELTTTEDIENVKNLLQSKGTLEICLNVLDDKISDI